MGKIPIQGDQVFALVQDNTTKPRAQGTWEAHRKYIDVQFVAAGVEEMGYANIKMQAFKSGLRSAAAIAPQWAFRKVSQGTSLPRSGAGSIP